VPGDRNQQNEGCQCRQRAANLPSQLRPPLGVDRSSVAHQLAARRVGRGCRPERHLDHKICAGSMRTRCGITGDADLMPLTGRLSKRFRWTGYLKEHARTCPLRVYLPLSLPPGAEAARTCQVVGAFRARSRDRDRLGRCPTGTVKPWGIQVFTEACAVRHSDLLPSSIIGAGRGSYPGEP